MVGSLLVWLLLGLAVGALVWPYQALSELGFLLQRKLWPLTGLTAAPVAAAWWGPALVFGATVALLALAWGPLAAGRGGGVAAALALDRQAGDADTEGWLAKLSLRTQLRRLPLLALAHLGGLAVGVESPSSALGAALLLAIRERWVTRGPLAALPLPLVAAIGGGAGLGAAFRSPLLGVVYGLEELGRRNGLSLLLPTLLTAGTGALVSTRLGQPARLAGLTLGPAAPGLWPWIAVVTLLGTLLGAQFVRLLIPLAHSLGGLLARRPARAIPAVALLLTLLALASGGLSLNDGSLSLAQALQGRPGGPPLTLLWRYAASLLSIAVGAPGGLMHNAMTLGALLVEPLRTLVAVAAPALANLPPLALAQLAAIGAVALFAAANGTPLFCALFVFTLQGDPQLLPLLLLVSAVSAALAEPWRGPTWNDHQAGELQSPTRRLPQSMPPA
jgi:H+/Cl- antiporter ClcA